MNLESFQAWVGQSAEQPSCIIESVDELLYPAFEIRTKRSYMAAAIVVVVRDKGEQQNVVVDYSGNHTPGSMMSEYMAHCGDKFLEGRCDTVDDARLRCQDAATGQFGPKPFQASEIDRRLGGLAARLTAISAARAEGKSLKTLETLTTRLRVDVEMFGEQLEELQVTAESGRTRKPSRSEERVLQMMKAYGVLAPSGACGFWNGWRKSHSMCTHVSQALAHLKKTQPNFVDELKARLDAVLVDV